LLSPVGWSRLRKEAGIKLAWLRNHSSRTSPLNAPSQIGQRDLGLDILLLFSDFRTGLEAS